MKYFSFYTNIQTSKGVIKRISYDKILLKAKDQEEYQKILAEVVIEIDIFDKIFKAKPTPETDPKNLFIWLLLEEKPSKDIIQKAIDIYKKPMHIPSTPKFKIQASNIEDFQSNDFIKSIMPLILELFDENTNVDKIYNLMRGLSELQEDILKLANSAYLNKGIEIKDVKSAIVRLGLSRFREYALKAISKESLEHMRDNPKELQNLESTLILQASIFDNVYQLIFLNAQRIYDFIILSMMDGFLIMLDFMSKQQNPDASNLKSLILKIIQKPSLMYSYISRVIEKDDFGKDVLLIDKEYLSMVFGGSKEALSTIHGIIAGYNSFESLYSLKMIEKFELEKYNVRIAFAIYLSILGTKFIVEDDKKSGVILEHRLKRFGLDSFLGFLNKCIMDANTTLRDLNIKKEFYKISSRPDFEFALKERDEKLPQSLEEFYVDFTNKIKSKRVCIRYEDEEYTVLKLQKAIDFLNETKSGSFCVIDLNTFLLPAYEDISFYDVILIKDIDKLKDIGVLDGIMKNFEGYVIMTLRNDIDLLYKNKDLFDRISDITIDFPSYMEDKTLYEDVLKEAQKLLGKEFNIANSLISDNMYDFKSLIRSSIAKI